MELSELIRGYYLAMDAGDVPRAMTVFHPDARYQRAGTPELVGREAITRFYTEQRPPGGQHRLDALATTPDRVLVEGRFVPEPGRSVRFCDSFRFDDGLVVERTTYALG